MSTFLIVICLILPMLFSFIVGFWFCMWGFYKKINGIDERYSTEGGKWAALQEWLSK